MVNAVRIRCFPRTRTCVVTSGLLGRIITILVFTAAPYSLAAQDKLLPVFHFDHLTTADGLPSNEIRSNVVTDRQGFIWIGTVLGLARYDGYSCKVYRHVQGDPHSISSNGIMSLALDRRGLLWVGTWDTGLSIYDASRDQFVNFLPRGKDTTLQGINAILMIHEDRAGNIWCSSSENRIVFANMSGLMDETNADSIAAHVRFIQFRVEGSQESIYLGDWGRDTVMFGTARGLYTCDRTNLHVQHLRLPPATGVNLDTVKIAAFWRESQERLWIATRSHGLFLFDRSRGSVTSFHKRRGDGKDHRDELIRDAVIDPRGRLWITTPTGLDLFEPPTATYAEYLTLPLDPPRHPMYASVDRAGRLWISTMDDGLYFLTARSFRFPHYALRGIDGRPAAMETIEEAGDGTHWISTEGKAVRVQLADLRVLQTIDLFKGQRPTYWRAGVLDSYRDRKGLIWYGTWGLGLYRFDPGTGRVENFRPSRRLAGLLNKEDVCWSVTGGSGDTLWIAGNRDGLLQFDPRTRTFSRRPLDGGPPLTYVSHVYKDVTGRIWISDEQQGVTTLDPSTNTVERFTHDPDRPGSISSNRGRYTYQDVNGNVWIGTSDLSLWDPGTRSFKQIPNTTFNDPAYVMPMGSDPQGRLWVYYYPGGVGVLEPTTHRSANFGRSDGLCPNVYEMSVLRDGRVLLLGWSGMNIFSPESLSIPHPIPPLVLTSMSINDSTNVPAHRLSGPALHLAYEQNTLELGFAAIDPGVGHQIRYAYRLEGLEDNWVHPVDRRFVRYPGLAPGEYVFRVKAISSLGRWHDQEISLEVTIAPPWWRSPWAHAAYGALVLGIILGSYRIRMRQMLLKQQAEMEHFQVERLADVDRMKSRFFSNISHEFRTPLTLILGLNEQLHDFTHDPAVLREKQRLIAENAQKLNALVGQLLDFARLESGIMRLQVSRSDIIAFLRRTVMSFESWAERKRISLEFRPDADTGEGFFDQDKLEKIVNNLMSNALKFTPDGGTLTVWVTRAQQSDVAIQNADPRSEIAWVKFSVSDTGPGIAPEHLSRVFDRFYRVEDPHVTEGTGIGLALTKELVELHHGRITVESTAGSGSVFTVEIPTERSAYPQKEIVEAAPRRETTGSAPAESSAQTPGALPTTRPVEGHPAVLIVEDNPDLREYIREYLEGEYAVFEAPDGQAGFDRAVEIVPDLVISDVMMPAMDGIELCRRLKQDVRTSHVPLILLTARAGIDSKLEGLETGADDYVVKPFDVKELLARTRNLVEQRRELRKKFSNGVVLKPGEVGVTSLDDALLQKAISFVEQHMAEQDLNVDLLALELAISRATLNRKLRALTNLSPAEFIRYLRLQRARELLEKNAGTVAEIAYQVGFGSPSHFSAAFHERFGMPPSEIHPGAG